MDSLTIIPIFDVIKIKPPKKYNTVNCQILNPIIVRVKPTWSRIDISQNIVNIDGMCRK